ncbi:MAG TPA: class I SAM-dependent methyltransferase [Methylomirabilota bacterium]|nr:class I SAM-dependent methyltransferase [Methylomirabilota bacterium]
MREGRPSRTAQRVAERRAAHQLFDRPLVFEDPLAIRIIGSEAAAGLPGSRAASNSPPMGGLRAFVAVRSRFAEDELARAVARGIRQYVVLGAGLDTFAYRNPHADLRVFEVDHPATQEWKRGRLKAAGIATPDSVTYVSVDFEHQIFAEELARAGFAPGQPAFFSWLGVVPYLNRETVFATLETIATMCPGNGVVFDYGVPRSSASFFERLAYDALARRVAQAGEAFRSFFDPAELAQELQRIGFWSIEDLGLEEIVSRYFADRSDDLSVRSSMGHLISASS